MGRLLVFLLCVVLVFSLVLGWTRVQSGAAPAATGSAPVTNASDLPKNDRPKPLVTTSNGPAEPADRLVAASNGLGGPIAAFATQPAQAGLWGTLCEFFKQVAQADHDFDDTLWDMLSGELRVVLGALKCLIILLVLFGIGSLGLIRQMFHRFLT